MQPAELALLLESTFETISSIAGKQTLNGISTQISGNNQQHCGQTDAERYKYSDQWDAFLL